MRSKSLLSLAEFCKFVGGDPWAFAGINRYSDETYADDIVLTAQYAYQRMPDSANDSTYAGNNSRQAAEQAILKGENLFLRWTRRYPVPVNVLAEKQDYPSAFKLRYQTVPALFKPKYKELQAFGVWVESIAEDGASVTKTVDEQIADVFSIDDVPVPDDTAAEDVHVYLNPDDGIYTGNPSRQHEIRPLTVTIDSSGGTGNWLAQIEGDAYLFVKPELYEIDPPQAIAHEDASYISTVDVYVRTVDSCQQGNFILPAPCSSLPCPDSESVALCMVEDKRGMYTATPVVCSEGSMTKSRLPRCPKRIEMNYIAGVELEDRLMAEEMVNLVARLALGYLPFDEESFEDYPTTPLYTSLAKQYRAIQKWESGRDAIQPQVSTKFELAVPENIQHLLGGLEPRRGTVEALGEILDRGWFVQSGSTHNS